MFDSPVKKRGKLPLAVGQSPVRSPIKRRGSLGLKEVFQRRSITPGEGSVSETSLLSASNSSCEEPSVPNQNSCSSFISHATNQTVATTHSIVQRIFESDAPCRLDSKKIVTVSNTWARVKRKEGYEEDVGEGIIICMMDLDPRTREKLRISSFRSPRFGEVCRAISDLLDLVVTLLGPDLDDEDLFEAGERFREEGIDLEIFSQCVSAGIQVRLSKKLWSSEVESAWRNTFEMLIPSMTTEQ